MHTEPAFQSNRFKTDHYDIVEIVLLSTWRHVPGQFCMEKVQGARGGQRSFTRNPSHNPSHDRTVVRDDDDDDDDEKCTVASRSIGQRLVSKIELHNFGISFYKVRT